MLIFTLYGQMVELKLKEILTCFYRIHMDLESSIQH